ncbi:TetR/AcrR family transcriptional regulator [Isoptericola sediminis]|uniref:TetR/AcrR family transcriptional regulator n=1 Tax=Isoptericola sediminis TaxID=2733572 RepID=A0A849KF01_9MICO|nr:TetR/AcrR family transcriptional regulator [Isoptericola sediminis]NNU27143.1 TetR/AcrR family transcriptional regulator [Isoptericola sediminis]
MSAPKDRRTAILNAARELASRDGVGAVTVRAVSAAAGIGVGTLRHYFPSQRELVDAVVADMVDGMLDESVILDRDVAPADRLAHALLQFLPASSADRGQLDAWFAFYVSALATQPSAHARRVLEASVVTSHEHLRRWLEVLTEEGALEVSSVADTSSALIALVNGLTLEALTPGSPVTVEDARRIAEAAARGVVRGTWL